MFACPGCGDNLRFDITTQRMHCRSCDGFFDVDEVGKETVADENSEDEKKFFDTTVFYCPQCGGEMMGDETDVTAVCSYCGADNVLETRLTKEVRPKYIVPFKITKEQAADVFMERQSKRFWVDKRFKKEIDVESFRAIYVPYYAYDMDVDEHIGVKTQKVTTSGNYTITDYYEVSGDVYAHFEDYAKDASSSFYDNIADSIAPFDRGAQVDFKPQYLSGFYADIADVPPSTYDNSAREAASNYIAEKITKDIERRSCGEPDGKTPIKSHPQIKNVDRLMYPVWFLSYRSRGRISYATVNGQTGKVAADAPLDVGKFVGFSLLAALPIFFILNIFLTLRPSTLLGLIALVSALVNAIFFSEMKEIFIREMNVGDLGLNAIEPGREERFESIVGKQQTGEKKKKKPKSKASVGGIIAIAVLAINFGGVMAAGLREFLSALNAFGNFWGGLYGLAGVIVMTIFFCINIAKGYNNVPGRITSAVNLVLITIATGINIMRPAEDMFYYSATIALIVVIFINMMMVVINSRRLSTRIMPQFKKKEERGR